MSDVKVLLKKYKPAFPAANRSTSLPSDPAADAGSPEEEAPPELPEEKKPLRRSKSGRVKVLTRTRSMVSTYDFNIDGNGPAAEEGGRQGVASAERMDSEMMKRIERIWPGMEEEEKKNKIVRFQDI